MVAFLMVWLGNKKELEFTERLKRHRTRPRKPRTGILARLEPLNGIGLDLTLNS